MPLVNVSVTLRREEDADCEPDIQTETTDPCFCSSKYRKSSIYTCNPKQLRQIDDVAELVLTLRPQMMLTFTEAEQS